jgi:uncharacterized protein (TIGR03118 family)
MNLLRPLLTTVAAAGLLTALPAHAQRYQVTNLVSDGTVPAVTTDPALINPWGVSYSPTGPFWVSDNGSGVSTIYNGAGTKLGLTVTIPPTGSAPTGQVFNSTSDGFKIGGVKPVFLFDSEDGVISGWSSGTTAQVALDNSGSEAIYKGLALGTSGSGSFLYAANFHSGEVEMYDSSFGLVKSFTDPTVAAGYAPFNAQVLGGELYVSFALQDADAEDDVAGAGHGYVDVFNLDGTFNRRLASLGGQINSPWGLDLAPANFGSFSNALLVGNFGDGTISAYDRLTGAFKGKMLDAAGNTLVLGDLWALINGNGGLAGDPNKVYFTAALEDEAHGLFGSLTSVPEPSTWAMMILGFGLVGWRMRRRIPAAA